MSDSVDDYTRFRIEPKDLQAGPASRLSQDPVSPDPLITIENDFNPGHLEDPVLPNVSGTKDNETLADILAEFPGCADANLCHVHNKERLFICLDPDCSNSRQPSCEECHHFLHESCSLSKNFDISELLRRVRVDLETPLKTMSEVMSGLRGLSLRVEGESDLMRYLSDQVKTLQNLEQHLKEHGLQDFSMSLSESDIINVRSVKLETVGLLLEKILASIKAKNMGRVAVLLEEVSRLIGASIRLSRRRSSHSYRVDTSKEEGGRGRTVIFRNPNPRQTFELDCSTERDADSEAESRYSRHSSPYPSRQRVLANLVSLRSREISETFPIFSNTKDFFRTRYTLEGSLSSVQLACETDSLIKISELMRENRALHSEIVGLKQRIRNMEDVIRSTFGGRFQIERVFPRSSHKEALGPFAALATSTILKLEDFSFVSQLFSGDFGLKLLYRSSRDGALANHFHRLCDGQGPTIVFAKSGNFVAGGFTDISWQSPENGIFCQTANAFLFSVTRRRRYPILQGKEDQAIHCHEFGGPCFGFDFCVGYEFHLPSSYSHGKVYDFSEAEEPSEELFGSREFPVEECEVYHVSIY